MKRGRCTLCEKNIKVGERNLCEECSIFSDEQIIKTKILKEIEDMNDDIRLRKEAFLRLFGWYSSCNYPDDCYRWVKVIRGETIAITLDCALNIEKNIYHFDK